MKLMIMCLYQDIYTIAFLVICYSRKRHIDLASSVNTYFSGMIYNHIFTFTKVNICIILEAFVHQAVMYLLCREYVFLHSTVNFGIAYIQQGRAMFS